MRVKIALISQTGTGRVFDYVNDISRRRGSIGEGLRNAHFGRKLSLAGYLFNTHHCAKVQSAESGGSLAIGCLYTLKSKALL